jgi:hypothetical protein
MSDPTKIGCAGTHQGARLLPLLVLALLVVASPALGEQSYVTRYDLFAGYTMLNAPKISLQENGFHFQFGVRPKTWYSLGFDYSIASGSLTLTPNLLTSTVQAQLTGLFQQLAEAGELPAGYTLSLNSNSTSQTITAGPQLAYRHFSKITLFIRPSIGAIHDTATPQPGSDPIAKIVVAALAPSGKKTDTTGFYGFGGGFDYIFSKHISVRVQADLVYQHLFNDLLQSGMLTTRFSIGPCFNFGKNIARK